MGRVDSAISSASGSCSPPRTTTGAGPASSGASISSNCRRIPSSRITISDEPSTRAAMPASSSRAGLPSRHPAPLARADSRSVSLVERRVTVLIGRRRYRPRASGPPGSERLLARDLFVPHRERVSELATTADTSLRAVFAGSRGRLLPALLLAEFAGAVQGIAYATVLPLAARELDGSRLYGATLAAGLLSGVVVLAAGPGVTARLPARQNVARAPGLFVVGVVLSACAPAMGWLLAGGVLRGIAGGLLA